VGIDILLHVDDVFSEKLGNLIYYMTTFIVGVTVAWDLVLFTLGVVPPTTVIGDLTATPWASSPPRVQIQSQGQQHQRAGVVSDTDHAIVCWQGAINPEKHNNKLCCIPVPTR
jgi:hypothetical protein